ncbi:MAG: LLM class flavin-dependent oxidoreductase [Acetobacterales bacterium]
MKLGLFSMPVHRPDKPWLQALREDQEQIVLADGLGFAEAWIGEHFSTAVEQIPSPMMFLATLIERTKQIRLGTGVVNLPYHHPVIFAAEAALFDQLSEGRLMLGIGPGGLPSDAEMFGHPDMGERVKQMVRSIESVIALWKGEPPVGLDVAGHRANLVDNIWRRHGVGSMCRPYQKPHPPLAMAVSGRNSGTAEAIGARGWIPISANFAPIEDVATHWTRYATGADSAGIAVDRSRWRVARSMLVTESDAQAEDILADPDGVFAFYFRYLRGLRRIEELRPHQEAAPEVLNEILGVNDDVRELVIAGSAKTVTEKLVDAWDRTGGFGTLLLAAHDWEDPELCRASIRRLAAEVLPAVRRHSGT